jgi:hypothetical protein
MQAARMLVQESKAGLMSQMAVNLVSENTVSTLLGDLIKTEAFLKTTTATVWATLQRLTLSGYASEHCPLAGARRHEKRKTTGSLRSPSFDAWLCPLALRTGQSRELDPRGTVAISFGDALSDQPCVEKPCGASLFWRVALALAEVSNEIMPRNGGKHHHESFAPRSSI